MIDSVVLYNTVLGQEISINRDSGGYFLDVADFGVVEGTPYTFKTIDQPGETLYNTGIETRDIAISGWVASWSEQDVTDLKLALNHFINPKHLIECYANGYKISFYPRNSIRYSTSRSEHCEVIAPFLISGFCPYPFFTTQYPTIFELSSTLKLFKFPLVIPKSTGVVMGVRQPSRIGEVDNTSDFEIGYILTFKAIGDGVKNPRIMDIRTQKIISIQKSLERGESIVVDTRQQHRRVYGISPVGVESNYFKYRTLDSEWLTLVPGKNYIQYDADENVQNLEISIEYELAFLECDT